MTWNTPVIWVTPPPSRGAGTVLVGSVSMLISMEWMQHSKKEKDDMQTVEALGTPNDITRI